MGDPVYRFTVMTNRPYRYLQCLHNLVLTGPHSTAVWNNKIYKTSVKSYINNNNLGMCEKVTTIIGQSVFLKRFDRGN
jgi:hypothetical protein